MNYSYLSGAGLMMLVFAGATLCAAADATPPPITPAASPSPVQVAANGFVVRHEVTLRATPQKTWSALVNEVGSWWKSEHTFSGDAKNLSIDARPGGCFCERLPNGGGVEHLRVVQAKPGEMLRFSGALGPLQASGLAGSLTWKLTVVSENTKVELTYVVGGFIQGGFEKIAPAVDSVLGEQLRRFKSFVETGDPTKAL